MTDPNAHMDARLQILLEWLEDNDESMKDLKENPNYDILDIDIGGVNYD